MAKIGVWLIGAQGSLASTLVLGARAIARQLAAGGGLVTELPELAPLPLVGVGDLAFGGWDIEPGGRDVPAAECEVAHPDEGQRCELRQLGHEATASGELARDCPCTQHQGGREAPLRPDQPDADFCHSCLSEKRSEQD